MEEVKKNYKGPMLLLMVNLFIIMVGIGLVIPILPYYVEAFNATGRDLGLLVASFAFMQFLLAPVWGRLSDRIGRKPLITLGMFGFAAAEFIFAFATDLWMLYASRILAGTFGSAIMPTAMAYVADVTQEEDRGKGMGLLGAAMALGIVIGPGIGGWLAEIDLSLPFLVAGLAGTSAAILSVFMLKETLSPEAMEEAKNEEKMNQFKRMWIALRSPVGFLLILVFVMSFALANFTSIFGFYALKRYGYDPAEVGIIVAITGVIGAVAQGTLVGRLTKRFGDDRVVTGSLLWSAIGFILMVFAFNYVTVILTVSIFFLGNSILRPALNSFISKLAGKQQGTIMGLNNSFLSLGNAAGPVLAGFLFEVNIHIPYLLGAAVLLGALAAMKVWTSNKVEQTIENSS
ncbi:MFS transporter [Pseudalkalibacillus salsuginis]|uniref:MFS transporter n=1 Tax=Pseudalkalibacillus salsuginis TaxID=2910972 RepID=UPI001F20C588|nr:MFS transporter [Pseudalkalibacillus salsuginis]MCF6411029.1 MFS transporter [Pseudalkalibacillus salsuginis]